MITVTDRLFELHLLMHRSTPFSCEERVFIEAMIEIIDNGGDMTQDQEATVVALWNDYLL